MVIIAVVRLPGRELDELLPSVIPADHARQTIADHYVERGIGRAEGRPWRVLDLGCGSGSSVDLFRARDPDVQWVGLDVPESPEPPTRTDARFETFDGISIPFGEGSFDLVYCKQVLEHVRHPKPLLADVRRILAPGGYFAGSTSQLEPFHSLSMWNYTPLGFYEIAKEAGLRLIELRPGIDGRRARRAAAWWAADRPFDSAGGRGGGVRRSAAQRPWSTRYGSRARVWMRRAVNATKLLFCGQFTFLAQRAD